MPKLPTKLLPGLRLIPLLCLAVGLSACQLAPQAPVGVLSENPLEVEPLAVPMRTEIAIARISEMLHSAKLTETERARLMFDRGVMYDSIGLSALARYDFMRALRLKPDMADAYNFMGIHQTLNGDYSGAYESFDAALELQPDYQYAYLNRAIALQYDGKLELAIADFQRYQQLKPTDPFRVIWLYLAQAEQSAPQALAQLAANAKVLPAEEWGSQLVAFLLGKLSESALLAKAGAADIEPQQRTERLCEAYFYLAKWHSQHNNPSQAASYYKKVLATNVYEFVEHRYARLELNRLRQQVVLTEPAVDSDAEHSH